MNNCAFVGKLRQKLFGSSLAATLIFVPLPVSALTLAEAQTLLVSDLAQRVLGNLGRVVKDMERPTGFINMPPGHAVPPTLYRIRFFTAAHIVSFAGLCEAREIDVDFDRAGNASGVEATAVYGVLHSFDGHDTEGEEYDRRSDQCKSAEVISGFFSSPNWRTADRGASAVQAIANDFRADTPISYPINCEWARRRPGIGATEPVSCGAPGLRESMTKAISADKISDVQLVDCKKPGIKTVLEILPDNSCLLVSLERGRQQPATLLISTRMKNSQLTILSLNYREGYEVPF